ncbi:hypothetical protein, partial [Actinacidiphila sp. bgisy167]|uniref:hypothetical protein n=1 Tax=Actinacidiphila sp. bgisy167 TaxID=3413797 RepID=UPI003D71C75A
MAAEFDVGPIRDLGNQWVEYSRRIYEYLDSMNGSVSSLSTAWTGKTGRNVQVVWDSEGAGASAPFNVYNSIFEAAWVADQLGQAILAYADELQKTIDQINRAHLVEALAVIFGTVLGIAAFGIGGILGAITATVGRIVEAIASLIGVAARAANVVGRIGAFAWDAAVNAALTLGTDVASGAAASAVAKVPFVVDWKSEGLNMGLSVWAGGWMGGVETHLMNGKSLDNAIAGVVDRYVFTPPKVNTPDLASLNLGGAGRVEIPDVTHLAPFPVNSVIEHNAVPPLNAGRINETAGAPVTSIGKGSVDVPAPGGVRDTQGLPNQTPGGAVPGRTAPGGVRGTEGVPNEAPGGAVPGRTAPGDVRGTDGLPNQARVRQPTVGGEGPPRNLVKDGTAPVTVPHANLDGPPRSAGDGSGSVTVKPLGPDLTPAAGGKIVRTDPGVQDVLPPTSAVPHGAPGERVVAPPATAPHTGGAREYMTPGGTKHRIDENGTHWVQEGESGWAGLVEEPLALPAHLDAPGVGSSALLHADVNANAHLAGGGPGAAAHDAGSVSVTAGRNGAVGRKPEVSHQDSANPVEGTRAMGHTDARRNATDPAAGQAPGGARSREDALFDDVVRELQQQGVERGSVTREAVVMADRQLTDSFGPAHTRSDPRAQAREIAAHLLERPRGRLPGAGRPVEATGVGKSSGQHAPQDTGTVSASPSRAGAVEGPGTRLGPPDTSAHMAMPVHVDEVGGGVLAAHSLASDASLVTVTKQHDIGSGSSADAGAHNGGRAVETAHGPGDRPGHDANAVLAGDDAASAGNGTPDHQPGVVETAHGPGDRPGHDANAVLAGDDAASAGNGTPDHQPGHTPTPEGAGGAVEWNAFKQEHDAKTQAVVDAEARLELHRQDLDTAWDRGYDTFVENNLFGSTHLSPDGRREALSPDGREARIAKSQWRKDITREFRLEVERTGHISSDAFTRIVDRAKSNAHKYLVRADQIERFTARFKEQVSAYKANRFGEGGDLPQFDGLTSKYVFDHDLQTYVKDDTKAYGIDDTPQGPDVKKLNVGGTEEDVFVEYKSDDGPRDHFRDKTHDYNVLEQYYIGKHDQLTKILGGFARDGDTSGRLPAHTGRQIERLLDGVFDDLGKIATREHDIRVATGEKFDDIADMWGEPQDDFVQQVRLDFQRDLRTQYDVVFRHEDADEQLLIDAANDAHTLPEGDKARAQWNEIVARAIDGIGGRFEREGFVRDQLTKESLHAQDRFADLGEHFLAHFGENGRQRVIGEYLDTVRTTARRWFDSPKTGDSAPQWIDVRDDLRSTLPDRIRHEGDLQFVVGESAHAFHEILGHPLSTESFQLHEDVISRLGDDFRTDRVVKYDEMFAPTGHKSDAWLSHESRHEDAFQSHLGDLRDGGYYPDIVDPYPAFRDWRTAEPAGGKADLALTEPVPSKTTRADLGLDDAVESGGTRSVRETEPAPVVAPSDVPSRVADVESVVDDAVESGGAGRPVEHGSTGSKDLPPVVRADESTVPSRTPEPEPAEGVLAQEHVVAPVVADSRPAFVRGERFDTADESTVPSRTPEPEPAEGVLAQEHVVAPVVADSRPAFVPGERFDVRRFDVGGAAKTELHVRVAFDGARSPEEADGVLESLREGVVRELNGWKRYHRDWLQVTVERVETGGDAHLTVALGDGDVPMGTYTWWRDAEGHELAQQLGVHLGLLREVPLGDSAREALRARDPEVHDSMAHSGGRTRHVSWELFEQLTLRPFLHHPFLIDSAAGSDGKALHVQVMVELPTSVHVDPEASRPLRARVDEALSQDIKSLNALVSQVTGDTSATVSTLFVPEGRNALIRLVRDQYTGRFAIRTSGRQLMEGLLDGLRGRFGDEDRHLTAGTRVDAATRRVTEQMQRTREVNDMLRPLTGVEFTDQEVIEAEADLTDHFGDDFSDLHPDSQVQGIAEFLVRVDPTLHALHGEALAGSSAGRLIENKKSNRALKGKDRERTGSVERPEFVQGSASSGRVLMPEEGLARDQAFTDAVDEAGGTEGALRGLTRAEIETVLSIEATRADDAMYDGFSEFMGQADARRDVIDPAAAPAPGGVRSREDVLFDGVSRELEREGVEHGWVTREAVVVADRELTDELGAAHTRSDPRAQA